MVQRTNRISVSRIALCALAMTLAPACTNAQAPAATEATAPAPGPAVWTLGDEDTTVHLFGYAQVVPEGTEWQSEAFQAAFAEADALVLESDGASPEAQGAIQGAMQSLGLQGDGGKLGDALSDEQTEEIGAFTETLGVPLQALAPMKPWLANVQVGVLAVSRRGYDLAGGPQPSIVAAATERGLPVHYLESPTALMNVMAGFPADVQANDLVHTVRSLRDKPDELDTLAGAWAEGDVETIGTILHGEDGAWSDPMIYDAMLIDRNASWADEITRMIDEETGTYFVAIGLGHLAGKDSLVTMLEARGQSVVRE